MLYTYNCWCQCKHARSTLWKDVWIFRKTNFSWLSSYINFNFQPCSKLMTVLQFSQFIGDGHLLTWLIWHALHLLLLVLYSIFISLICISFVLPFCSMRRKRNWPMYNSKQNLRGCYSSAFERPPLLNRRGFQLHLGTRQVKTCFSKKQNPQNQTFSPTAPSFLGSFNLESPPPYCHQLYHYITCHNMLNLVIKTFPWTL